MNWAPGLVGKVGKEMWYVSKNFKRYIRRIYLCLFELAG